MPKPYTLAEVARGLDQIALGNVFNDAVLRAAHEVCAFPSERAVIGRYRRGDALPTDHLALQGIAVTLRLRAVALAKLH